MSRAEIPDEVYELINGKDVLAEGATLKVRHLYQEDGEACSLHKSRAMAITRTADGWTWYCHRCKCRGGIKQTNMSPAQVRAKIKAGVKKQPLTGDVSLPSDCIQIMPAHLQSTPKNGVPWDAVTWLLKCGITTHLIKQYYFAWSPKFQRVITPILSSTTVYEDVNTPVLLGWIGRDVVTRTKEERAKEKIPKWLIRKATDKRMIFTAQGKDYHPDIKPKCVVITEDVMSAIRVAEAMNCVAYAMLNTDIPRDFVERLASYGIGGNLNQPPIILWLDSDMAGKMMSKCTQLRTLGFHTQYIVTRKDPKCYNDVGIRTALDQPISNPNQYGFHI